MRIVITGATGNVGTALVRALVREGGHEVVGVARGRPPAGFPGVRLHTRDVATDPLETVFRGADAVVHLAWTTEPARDERALWRVNVDGSQRVIEATLAAGVPALVHASSIGAYAAAPGRVVDETHPATGIPTSWYSRQKARVEGILDTLESEHPALRVVRLRPALVVPRRAGRQVRRLLAGPVPRRLAAQAVHADDVADAYRLAVTDPELRGPYNVAAPPVLDAASLEARSGVLPLPPAVRRSLLAAAWRLRLQPTAPGWLDLAHGAPVIDAGRMRAAGWVPRRSGLDALDHLLAGTAP